jgi:hypothetical protein
MIDSVLNLLFRCSHKRITRPITPVSKAGVPQGETYIVCLDCGKQFAYDLKKMQIGKAVRNSAAAGVLPPEMPKPRPSPVKVALVASAVPLAWLLGSVWKSSSKKIDNKTPPDTRS